MCGAHDRADHQRVVPQMRNVIRVILLVEGDDHLGPTKLHQSDKVVDDIHLLVSDLTLQLGLIGLGAPKIMRQRSTSKNSFSSSGMFLWPLGQAFRPCLASLSWWSSP